jgi:hypothetical protein
VALQYDDLVGRRLRSIGDHPAFRPAAAPEPIQKLAFDVLSDANHGRRGMQETQKSCPHCGHAAFRLIEGTLEGAECLGCGRIFSLRRKSEPDTTGQVESARAEKGFDVAPPLGIESDLMPPLGALLPRAR